MNFLRESIAAAGRLISNDDDGRRKIQKREWTCLWERNAPAAHQLHQADTIARRLERGPDIILVLASQAGPLSGLGVYSLVSRLTASPQIQTGVGFMTTIIISSAALVLAHERAQPQRNQARRIRTEAMDQVSSRD